MLGAMLPSVGDTKPMVNSIVFHNNRFANLFLTSDQLEFARPGKQLLQPGGPIPEYYDERGNLNEGGVDVVRRAIEAKLLAVRSLRNVVKNIY